MCVTFDKMGGLEIRYIKKTMLLGENTYVRIV